MNMYLEDHDSKNDIFDIFEIASTSDSSSMVPLVLTETQTMATTTADSTATSQYLIPTSSLDSKVKTT